MHLIELTDDLTAGELVGMLADARRCFAAYRQLLRLGEPARRAALDGLEHAHPQVREYCCKILDRLMDAEAVRALTAALIDQDERVRLAATHGAHAPVGVRRDRVGGRLRSLAGGQEEGVVVRAGRHGVPPHEAATAPVAAQLAGPRTGRRGLDGGDRGQVHPRWPAGDDAGQAVAAADIA